LYANFGTGFNANIDGSKLKAKMNAMKTPMAAYIPNSLTGLIPLVSNVRNPKAVVKDVRNVAIPTCL